MVGLVPTILLSLLLQPLGRACEQRTLTPDSGPPGLPHLIQLQPNLFHRLSAHSGQADRVGWVCLAAGSWVVWQQSSTERWCEVGAASQPTGLQVARHGCLAARIIDCGCCCLAARLTAAKRPKVVFTARAAGLRHVRRLQATLHRSTCLYMGAGCLQSDGQTNAKVTAMQLLL